MKTIVSTLTTSCNECRTTDISNSVGNYGSEAMLWCLLYDWNRRPCILLDLHKTERLLRTGWELLQYHSLKT